MESLSDPGSLRGVDGVPFSEERHAVDPESLEAWKPLAGILVVGLTNGDGEVLLMDGPHGWRLPYVSVHGGEDWTAVARGVAGHLSGSPVEVTEPGRVCRVTRRSEETGAEVVTHDVLLGARTVPGERSEEGGFADRTDHVDAVEWFDAVPDGAYSDHDETVDDIRRYLD